MTDCNCRVRLKNETGIELPNPHYADCPNARVKECEECNGTGYVSCDEYSREGQLIGVGTEMARCYKCKARAGSDEEIDYEAI